MIIKTNFRSDSFLSFWHNFRVITESISRSKIPIFLLQSFITSAEIFKFLFKLDYILKYRKVLDNKPIYQNSKKYRSSYAYDQPPFAANAVVA